VAIDILNSSRTLAKAMSTRFHQIEEAHYHTLSWLLDATEEGPGLMAWLANGNGTFWIQGLPGSGKSTAMKYLCLDEEVERILQTAE
jgi:HrpA-like RNA helicase